MSRFETVQKKLGRGLAYDLAIDFQRSRPCEGGTVCLAGPGAHDVGPLGVATPEVRPEQRLFVDLNQGGLDAATRRMPGVRTHLGQLSSAPLPSRIKLAVLDFCGHADGLNFRAMAYVGRKMANNGVMAVTTLRAREKKDTSTSKWLRDRASEDGWADPRSENMLLELATATGRRPAMIPLRHGGRDVLGKKSSTRFGERRLLSLGCVPYKPSASPMLITVFAFTNTAPPWSMPMAQRWVELNGDRHYLAKIRRDKFSTLKRMCLLIDKYTDYDFGEYAKEPGGKWVMTRKGDREYRGYERAAALLDVTIGTIRAWLAHRTRGTYDKAKPKDIRQAMVNWGWATDPDPLKRQMVAMTDAELREWCGDVAEERERDDAHYKAMLRTWKPTDFGKAFPGGVASPGPSLKEIVAGLWNGDS